VLEGIVKALNVFLSSSVSKFFYEKDNFENHSS